MVSISFSCSPEIYEKVRRMQDNSDYRTISAAVAALIRMGFAYTLLLEEQEKEDQERNQKKTTN